MYVSPHMKSQHMPSPSHRRFLPFALAALGSAIGLGFFVYQLSLPPLFRGLKCCDSTIYLTQARMMVRPLGDTKTVPVLKIISAPKTGTPGSAPAAAPPRSRLGLLLQTLFSSTDKYMPGYGIFLALHVLASNLTGGLLPWIDAALWTALLLQTLALVFFWRSANRAGVRIPAWALGFTLAYPALATQVAIPTSDAFGLTLVFLGFGLFLRVFSRAATLRSLGLACLTGILLASAIWVRSIYVPALAVFFLAWLGTGLYELIRRKNMAVLLLAAAASACAMIALSPRFIACYRASGTLCLQEPATAGSVTGELLRRGMVGARTYTLLRPIEPHAGTFVTIPDPLLQSIPCEIGDAHPESQFLGCALRNWYRMPGYALVKIIGILDDPFLSSYATYVTPPWLRIVLRLMALPVLAGVLAAAWLVFVHRRKNAAWNLTLLFFALYVASLLPVTIEYRYGLPLIPAALLSLGQLVCFWRAETIALRYRVAFAVLAAPLLGVFWLRTAAWDRLDPIPFIPASRAAKEDVLKTLATSLPPSMTQ